MSEKQLEQPKEELTEEAVFKKIIHSDKTKIILSITFIVIVILFNSSFFIRQSITPYSFLVNINDADRTPDGTTIIQVSELQTAFKANAGKTGRWQCTSGLIEINSQGDILWSFLPDGLTHHVDHEIVAKNNGYFFCDSFGDAIKYVRKKTKEVEWTYHLGDINWTEVNPEWCAEHYYNLPCDQWNLKECIDWSHVNDIDFKNYSSWEAMLVSIRNFNLVIEVNYTSAREKDVAVASDIVWYYRGNLSHQHNPDYLPNGNILIVDSNNNQFIEVNRTTKEIVWQWFHPSIEWARDCDLMPDDRYLITDIDKAMIINRTTGKILHTFPRFFGGYEADYLNETNTVLIACGSSGEIFEYSLDTGEKVWSWGSNVLRQITIGNVVIFILFEISWIIIAFSLKTKMKWMIIIPMLILIGLEIYVVVDFYTLLTKLFVRMING